MSNNNSVRLVKKVIIPFKIEVLTGLHIGDSKDMVEIGGIDIPVVRSPLKNNQPYIPGSSLKGKMRSLLELAFGANKVGKSEMVNRLFGSTENKKEKIKPKRTRLIVRDAYLTETSAKKLEELELPMPFTEVKFENTIDRVSGTAQHPRQIERVPAGAEFEGEFVLNFYEDDTEPYSSGSETKWEEKLIELLEEGIRLLNNDYLGGNGSRGYGQISLTYPSEKEKIKFSEYEKWNEEEGKQKFKRIEWDLKEIENQFKR